MVKKYTMQDIAKAANVSKATVSYVLNDKKNARISDETRRRILQIANLYQYVPNLSAKYLCDNKKKLIGVIIGDSSCKSFISECKIIYMLYEIFHADDYKLVLLDNKRQDNYMDLAYDLILAINISEEQIRNIGINTYSPMILFDSMFSDNLFFKLINNYQKAVEKAINLFDNKKECVLIYSLRNNKGINNIIESISLNKIAFTGENRNDVDVFINNNIDKNFIAIGDIPGFIALSAIRYDQLILITFSENVAFPVEVKQIVFDNQVLKDNIKIIFEKLDARQAVEKEQHIFLIDPSL